MTSVPRTPTAAPPGRRARCCRCRKQFTRKRPSQIFCGSGCRKRGADAKTPPKTGSDLQEQGSGAAHLGNKTTEFPTPLSPAETRKSEAGKSEGAQRPSEESRATAARARKAARYAGRRTLWKVTGDPACKGCGRALMDPASGVIVAQTATGQSAVLGLMRCGRVWLCPVCSAAIRHGRAAEITKGVVSWLKSGGQAYLVTFTARHAASDRLAGLMDAIQGTRADKATETKRRPGAYQRLITGGTWAGRPDRIDDDDDEETRAKKLGIRHRIGYAGMIRATEVTVGQANGWHPHIHAIVLVGGRTEAEWTKGKDGKVRETRRLASTFEPGAEALKEWEDNWRAVWTRHLAQVDPDFKPSDKHGVDFKPLRTVRDAEDLGEYIAKTQDGKVPGLELARGDLKSGRHGNMAPMELLGRIGDLTGGVPEDDVAGHGPLTWCLALWHEYERATKGRRAIEWTRGLRPLLGLTGGDTQDDDLDVLAESAASGGEFRGGVRITDTGWTAVARRALDLAVVEAGEGTDANTDPGSMADRVREVVDTTGETDAVQQLGPADVAQAHMDLLAALAERRAAAAARRRREQEETDDQEHDADAVRATAHRAIAKRFGGDQGT